VVWTAAPSRNEAARSSERRLSALAVKRGLLGPTPGFDFKPALGRRLRVTLFRLDRPPSRAGGHDRLVVLLYVVHEGTPMAGTRKLAAILVADIVGYSRLAGADEDRTLSRLRGLHSDLIDPAI
jgi:hypothetical protein